jgi:hypothetical protein
MLPERVLPLFRSEFFVFQQARGVEHFKLRFVERAVSLIPTLLKKTF